MSPRPFFWMVLLFSFCILNLGGCSSNCCSSNKLWFNTCNTCSTCNTCNSSKRYSKSRCECRRWSWEQRFQARGIQLIQVGDYVKFVLPSDYFFLSHSATELDPRYTCGLDMVASFICGLEKMNLKVAGYTDDEDCHLRNLALSREQAQVIANYLQRRGVDARVLYATGYGECVPVACNTTCKGREMNRRIEITFRKITDDYDH